MVTPTCTAAQAAQWCNPHHRQTRRHGTERTPQTPSYMTVHGGSEMTSPTLSKLCARRSWLLKLMLFSSGSRSALYPCHAAPCATQI